MRIKTNFRVQDMTILTMRLSLLKIPASETKQLLKICNKWRNNPVQVSCSTPHAFPIPYFSKADVFYLKS